MHSQHPRQVGRCGGGIAGSGDRAAGSGGSGGPPGRGYQVEEDAAGERPVWRAVYVHRGQAVWRRVCVSSLVSRSVLKVARHRGESRGAWPVARRLLKTVCETPAAAEHSGAAEDCVPWVLRYSFGV